jgi:tagaturonate reductase
MKMKHVKNFEKPSRPVRVIQFGGGVFLRGFFDWMLQRANDAGVFCGNAVIVRSKTRGTDPLAAQNFNYTQILRDGAHDERCVVDCIAGSVAAEEAYESFLALAENADTDVVVSNTTEAGLVYEYCERPVDTCPKSYPAKLTALLYHRYKKGGNGMLILPLELIEGNGDILKDTVLRHAADWGLEQSFAEWVSRECSFRNTLVDRIVSGLVPAESVELAYEDELVNTGEYFHLLVIEGPEDPRLPLCAAGLNVKWVESVTPYRTIKVRILNGAHTSMIPYALLCGVETVRECLETDTVRAHLEKCLKEIMASMSGDEAEISAYADDVMRRFANPFIHHRCAAIALHSPSKFVVRVLPSILSYREKMGAYPKQLVFALAMLLKYLKQYGDGDDLPTALLAGRTDADILGDEGIWGVSLAMLAEEVKAYADS